MLITGLLALTVGALSAQKITTDTLWVGGVCGMCKDRIEAALDTKGIINAQYNIDQHRLVVTYNTRKIDRVTISKRLNDVGHDTELSKADDSVYQNIHDCCRYREHEHDHE